MLTNRSWFSPLFTKKVYSLCWLILLLLITSCRPPVTQVVVNVESDDPISFNILQLNDVYEISPLEGGKVGGLARVATVLKRLKQENPNTISVMAGDFLSPSFVGTLKMDGERVNGKQMIETLNAMGLDYATFGNHEFDFSKLSTLESRIDLSSFNYFSTNARKLTEDGQRTPFTQRGEDIPGHIVHEFTGKDGRSVKLGIVGVLLPFAQQDYLAYEDVTTSFRQGVNAARSESDLVIGLTHLNIDQDIQLAKDVPGLPLFMGGHEHENSNNFVGSTAILKADANAKTVYVHRFVFYPDCGLVDLSSELMPIDATIPADPYTQKVIDGWSATQNTLMAEMGYRGDDVLTTIDYVLHGKEVDVRTRQTNYGTLTMAAFRAAVPGADAYVMNSGSLRLDDDLTGTITEYDVLRSFPFGGPIVRQQMSGEQLIKLLDTGTKVNRGEGGYLQLLGPERNDEAWTINGNLVKATDSYVVVLPEFLAQGKESNLGFLSNTEIEQIDVLTNGLTNDIRDIVIAYVRSM